MKMRPTNGGPGSDAAEDGSAMMQHGEEGQTTVLMVLFLSTFLFGFVALGIDVESLFQGRRQAQAAADAAAVAAAEEASYGTASENAAATAIAKLNGFDTSLAVNPASVVVGAPTSGNYSGSSGYLQVLVSKPVPMFFARIVTGQSTVTVSARAVAGAGLTSPSCVCLEGTTGTDLALSNKATLNATSCGTTVDSSSNNAVTIVGASTLGGLAIGSISSTWDDATNGPINVNNGGRIASGTKVVMGISTSCAPPLPAVPSYSAAACTADPIGGGGGLHYSVGPNSGNGNTQTGNVICYNSLKIGYNGDTVNIMPGIYVINGGSLHFYSATATGGSGVFFYLTGGASLTIDNGASVTLSAPTSGTYAGTLVYQDASDSQPLSIQGGSNTNVSGTIYAPSSNVSFGNGSGNLFDDLVAKTLTMNGGALASSASSNFGSLNTSTAKLGE